MLEVIVWNAVARIEPKTDDHLVYDKLKAAGWQIVRQQSGTGSVTGFVLLEDLSEYTAALKVASEVEADIENLETVNMHLIDPNTAASRHNSLISGILGLSKEASAPEASPSSPAAPTSAAVTSSDMPTPPDAIWSRMTEGDRSKAGLAYMDSWIKYTTDRKGKAAWTPTRETTLLAHVSDGERSGHAKLLLSQQARESDERIKLLAEAVEMSKAVTKQFAEWTKLARRVPNLLILSIILSSLFVAGGLYLVDRQRLSGLEMGLLAFVFALMAISPATLLLIGRPLKGLDSWTPDSMFKAGKEEKKEEGKEAEDTPAEAKKPGEPPVETPKAEEDTVSKPDKEKVKA